MRSEPGPADTSTCFSLGVLRAEPFDSDIHPHDLKSTGKTFKAGGTTYVKKCWSTILPYVSKLPRTRTLLTVHRATEMLIPRDKSGTESGSHTRSNQNNLFWRKLCGAQTAGSRTIRVCTFLSPERKCPSLKKAFKNGNTHL